MSKLLIRTLRNLPNLVTAGLNAVIAVLIPVTTYCIADVRIRNASRIVQGISAGILLTYFIIAFSPKTRLIRLSFDFTTMLMQFFLFIYIGIALSSNCGPFLSAKMGLSVAGVTLGTRLIEIIIYYLTIDKDDKTKSFVI